VARSAIGELLRASNNEIYPKVKNKVLIKDLNLSLDGLTLFLNDLMSEENMKSECQPSRVNEKSGGKQDCVKDQQQKLFSADGARNFRIIVNNGSYDSAEPATISSKHKSETEVSSGSLNNKSVKNVNNSKMTCKPEKYINSSQDESQSRDIAKRVKFDTNDGEVPEASTSNDDSHISNSKRCNKTASCPEVMSDTEDDFISDVEHDMTEDDDNDYICQIAAGTSHLWCLNVKLRRGDVLAYVDSGSMCSVIRKDIYEQNFAHIKLEKFSGRIQGVSGKAPKCYGVCEIPYNIGGYIYTATTLVADVRPQILLGLNLLEKYGSVINHKTGEMVLGRQRLLMRRKNNNKLAKLGLLNHVILLPDTEHTTRKRGVKEMIEKGNIWRYKRID
jgi:hypothetical protein